MQLGDPFKLKNQILLLNTILKSDFVIKGYNRTLYGPPEFNTLSSSGF